MFHSKQDRLPTHESYLNRREVLALSLASVTAGVCTTEAANENGATCTLGFGNYGLPKLTTEQSIDAVASAGYDSIELYVLADRDFDASQVSKIRRREIRSRIHDQDLVLTSLMENLRPTASLDRHRRDLDRLRAACELAQDLGGENRPAVQTVLGGKDWGEFRDLAAERLQDWAKVAEQTGVTVAIKPHRGGAMSRPQDAVWLLERLGQPKNMKMWFDYSHYAFRQLPMQQMVETAFPVTAGIAVKDAAKVADRVTFALPGAAGTIDYAQLLQLFYQRGYRGDICVEVSSAVWKTPQYDWRSALKDCYQHMASSFQKASVPRPAS